MNRRRDQTVSSEVFAGNSMKHLEGRGSVGSVPAVPLPARSKYIEEFRVDMSVS
jgi:hypothetical protein